MVGDSGGGQGGGQTQGNSQENEVDDSKSDITVGQHCILYGLLIEWLWVCGTSLRNCLLVCRFCYSITRVRELETNQLTDGRGNKKIKEENEREERKKRRETERDGEKREERRRERGTGKNKRKERGGNITEEKVKQPHIRPSTGVQRDFLSCKQQQPIFNNI